MNLIKQYQGLRKEIYILAFGKVVTCLGSMVWPMMTLILSNKLGMSASNTATLLLVMNIIQIPCVMFAGYLADHYNKRNIIIICDLITVFCYLAISIMDMTMNTVILFFIAGLFAMMEHPAYDALIADLSYSKDRERAYSLTYLATNFGMILSPMIGGLLFAEHLKLSFFIDGSSTFISTILIFLFIKDVTPLLEDSSESKEVTVKNNLFEILKGHHIIIFYLMCYIVIEFIYSQYLFLLPLNLERLYGNQGAMYYGMITSVNAVIVVAGIPILTMILKKVKDIDKILMSTVLFAIGLSMYIFIQGKVPFYFVSVIIFTIGEDINALGQQPYLTKRIPASHRGRIFSLQRTASAIFVAIAQKGIGVLIDNHSMNYMWILVSIISLIGIIMVGILRYLDKKEYSIEKAEVS